MIKFLRRLIRRRPAPVSKPVPTLVLLDPVPTGSSLLDLWSPGELEFMVRRGYHIL